MLLTVATESRREPGCVELQVFERRDQPGSFVLWEIFASSAAVTVHEATDYMKRYFASSLVASREVFWHTSIS